MGGSLNGKILRMVHDFMDLSSGLWKYWEEEERANQN